MCANEYIDDPWRDGSEPSTDGGEGISGELDGAGAPLVDDESPEMLFPVRLTEGSPEEATFMTATAI